eukprot:782065-Pelagomonas_calceolata.AAC.2
MSRGAGPNTGGAGGARGGERQGLIEMVQLLSKRNLTPVAVFCFSKKRCAPCMCMCLCVCVRACVRLRASDTVMG